MTAMSKDDLIAGDEFVTEQVELKRGVVVVRGLNRDEAIKIGDAKTTLDRDRKMVSWGCVEPELTYQDVEKWQKKPGSAGEIEKVSFVIAKLSGMLEGSEKKAYKSFADEPEPEL